MKKKLLLAMGLLGALAFATGEVAAQEKTTAAPATASPAKPEKPAKTTPGAATTKTSKAAKTAKGEKAATGEKAAAAAPAMPKPGPETAALKPFVANLNWTGTVKAGAHGPDSPEMATRGHQRCRFIQGNFWAQCELQDTVGKGKAAMKWKATELVGYDLGSKGYVSYIVDDLGNAMAMKGTLEGQKLTLEGEGMMNGEPVKERITMDATDPKAIHFTDERSVKGGPMTVTQEAVMKR